MKKFLRKIVAFATVLFMLGTVVPFGVVFADDTSYDVVINADYTSYDVVINDGETPKDYAIYEKIDEEYYYYYYYHYEKYSVDCCGHTVELMPLHNDGEGFLVRFNANTPARWIWDYPDGFAGFMQTVPDGMLVVGINDNTPYNWGGTGRMVLRASMIMAPDYFDTARRIPSGHTVNEHFGGMPPEPVKVGYVFDGWILSPIVGGIPEPFTGDTPVLRDTSVQATFVEASTAFVPVTDITEVPTAKTVGDTLTLTGTVVPANATNQTIIWEMMDAGGTGALFIGGNTLENTVAAGTITVRATIVNGIAVGTDVLAYFFITVYEPAQAFTLTFDPGTPSAQTSGTAVTDMPGNITVYENTRVYLEGILPLATGYDFTGWLVFIGPASWPLDGQTLPVGGTFDMPAGNVTLVAQWTEQFISVTNITGVQATKTAGVSLALTGTVLPANATNSSLVWDIADPGTTGATISGNMLSTTAAGNATVQATIANGIATGVDYTQNFNIAVTAPPAGGTGPPDDGIILDEVTVNFDLQGGTATFPLTHILTSGATISEPMPPPTRENATFAGWYTSATGGTQFNFAWSITSDTTIFARWHSVLIKKPTNMTAQIGETIDWTLRGFHNPNDFSVTNFAILDAPGFGLNFQSGRLPAFTNGSGITYDILYRIYGDDTWHLRHGSVDASRPFNFYLPQDGSTYYPRIKFYFGDVPASFGLGNEIVMTFIVGYGAPNNHLINRFFLLYNENEIEGKNPNTPVVLPQSANAADGSDGESQAYDDYYAIRGRDGEYFIIGDSNIPLGMFEAHGSSDIPQTGVGGNGIGLMLLSLFALVFLRKRKDTNAVVFVN